VPTTRTTGRSGQACAWPISGKERTQSEVVCWCIQKNTDVSTMVECVCGNRQYRHLCLCCGDRLLMIWVFFARWTICLCENVRWKR
jgi:hypothetical protein